MEEPPACFVSALSTTKDSVTKARLVGFIDRGYEEDRTQIGLVPRSPAGREAPIRITIRSQCSASFGQEWNQTTQGLVHGLRIGKVGLDIRVQKNCVPFGSHVPNHCRAVCLVDGNRIAALHDSAMPAADACLTCTARPDRPPRGQASVSGSQ